MKQVGQLGLLRGRHAACSGAGTNFLCPSTLSMLKPRATPTDAPAAGPFGAGWASFLLPSPAALADSLAARPDNRALLAPAAQQHSAAGGASSSGGGGPSQSAAQRAQQEAVDRQAVEGMLGEARRIVASDRFHDTLVVRRLTQGQAV